MSFSSPGLRQLRRLLIVASGLMRFRTCMMPLREDPPLCTPQQPVLIA